MYRWTKEGAGTLARSRYSYWDDMAALQIGKRNEVERRPVFANTRQTLSPLNGHEYPEGKGEMLILTC
jgi:hypothetical protein